MIQEGQPLCDIYNDNQIGGRSNWVSRKKEGAPSFEGEYWYYVSDSPAVKMTSWLVRNTGVPSASVGQGFWSTHLSNLLQQHNQLSDYNFGAYMGDGVVNTTRDWQFLTCYSPS